MKSKLKNIAAVLFSGLLMVSCNDRLEVTPPNSIYDEQVQELIQFGTDEQRSMILKAVAGDLPAYFRIANKTYSGYSSYPFNSQIDQDFLRNMMGNDVVLGDELAFARAGSHGSAYALQPTLAFWASSQISWNQPFWILCCDPIIAANKAVIYLSQEVVGGQPLLQDYRARCLVTRAYGYMMLMERFQKAYMNGGKDGKGMPIYTEYKINDPVAPLSATETYRFILGELKESVSLFKSAGIGYTEASGDIDLGVAQYLLARAALWAGEYETCITACREILLAYPEFIKEENYGASASFEKDVVDGMMELKAIDNAFYSISKNPECILGFKNGDGTVSYTYDFCNIFGEGEGGVMGLAPSIDTRLYGRMDDRDFRKALFTTEVYDYTYPKDKTVATIGKYANMKWAATFSLGSEVRDEKMDCDNIYIRSSEVCLMLAEALATVGRDAEAQDVLDKLLAARTKAGSPVMTCNNYAGHIGLSTIEKVRLQWRLEMWCEKGLEFYNNKRWNIPVDRSGSANHFRQNPLSVDHMTLEIPFSETTANNYWAQ